jgi:hypothetical protein
MKTHGMTGTRLYRCWENMKKRCLNPRHPRYVDWGGRGIKVCKAWLHFEAFQAWATSHGYTDDLVIDRRDNDKGYNPANCRWVTHSVSGYNRRAWSDHPGVRKRLQGGWRARGPGASPKHLGTFDTLEEAIAVCEHYRVTGVIPSRRQRNNTSGATGVYQRKSGNWRAQYQSRSLGTFPTVQEAVDARQKHIEEYA